MHFQRYANCVETLESVPRSFVHSRKRGISVTQTESAKVRAQYYLSSKREMMVMNEYAGMCRLRLFRAKRVRRHDENK